MHFDEKFWLAITFIIFVSISFKYIKQYLIVYIDRKIAELSAKIVEAENLRLEAEKLLHEITIKVKSQDSENKQFLDDARNNIKNTIEEKKSLFTQEMNNKHNEAIQKIEQRKNMALMDMHKNFVELAHSIAEKYLQDHENELKSDVELAKKYMNLPN